MTASGADNTAAHRLAIAVEALREIANRLTNRPGPIISIDGERCREIAKTALAKIESEGGGTL